VPDHADAHDLPGSSEVRDRKLAHPTLVPDSYFARDAGESLHGATSRRGLHPGGGRGEQPVAPVVPDLERLETALQWLQCEADAARFRSPPLLERERMAPPAARAPSRALRWLLTILFATAGAASLAYFFSGERPVSASTRDSPSQLATLQHSFDAVRPIRQEQAATVGLRSRDPGESMVPSMSPRPADVPRAAPTPAVETVALPEPQPAGVETPRPSTPVHALDREKISLLLGQGEQLISAGDIAAARTVFQRAAQAGDAAALVALAASYDPTALKSIGVVGMHADLQKARDLYEKAARLGSAEATRRLRMLARQ
jgi:hypothetical protein